MRIALDDYGVGNSNLQLWAEMQPDLVKIDRYFFRGIGQDDRKQNMVRAILKVAQHLGTAIVAEGIRRPRTWPWCASWTSATPRAGCWPPRRGAADRADAAAARFAAGAHAPPLARSSAGGTAASLKVEAPAALLDKHQ